MCTWGGDVLSEGGRYGAGRGCIGSIPCRRGGVLGKCGGKGGLWGWVAGEGGMGVVAM